MDSIKTDTIQTIQDVLGDAIAKHGYLSGCSTHVSPISYWVGRGKIEVLLACGTTREDIEDKAEQITARCGFKLWTFVDNHGDCPDEVRFYYA